MTQTPVAYIDDQPYPFKVNDEAETLLDFVRRQIGEQHSIPTLCHTPHLKPFGACRVCSVEIAREPNGERRVVAACHTLVTPDLYVYPTSPRVERLRRNIVELILTDHPLECLTCGASGACELQAVAARVGIGEVRYPTGKNHLSQSPDQSHPYLRSDFSKCINCQRCVRACDEVQGQFVLSMHGRGFNSRIIKDADTTFNASSCVSCGACVQACPTEAISDVQQAAARSATRVVRTVCSYCGVGCNLEVAARGDEVLGISAPESAEVNAAHTCVKGRYAFGFYKHPDRLRSPLIRRDGKLTAATWDEAYAYLAEKITAIRTTNGADAIAGISSSRCTNEENFLMQKFFRAVIGTNNIDGCARVCHAPTAHGMQQSFGTGAATNSIAELAKTQAILLVGANPTNAHPVTGARIKQAAIKHADLIVIDPRKTELTKYARHHLQLRPGSNVAVLNMLAYFIVTEGLVDEEFVKERTEAYDEYAAALRALDIAEMERVSDVSAADVRAAAITYARVERAMCFHGLGVTEHSQGSKSVMLIANLVMLTGNLGKVGGGMNPLRGQNNVQGAADMGVQPHLGAGYLDVTRPESQAHYEKHYGVKVPTVAGLKIPEMLDAARAGSLKALWIVGEDVVQTDPNLAHTQAALKNLDLLVVQELFMTNTAQMADVVLPGASFLEKSGTFTNGERRIQRVNQVIPPLSGTKADGEIIVEMMNRLGYSQPPYEAAGVLAEIAAVVPFFAGVRWAELGDNGKQWPVTADGADTQILHREKFKRENGLGKFYFHAYEESLERTEHAGAYPFILTTGRELEHYNCGSMTRRTANRDLLSADTLLIHPEDATAKGIGEGDRVCLSSSRGEVELSARLSRRVRRGVLYTSFHFPEVMINRITGNVSDTETLCPEYKVVSVEIKAL